MNMKKQFVTYEIALAHKKLMGDDSFVEIDDTPEWKEFNKLTIKINKK